MHDVVYVVFDISTFIHVFLPDSESEISWSFSDAFPGLPLLELLSKFSLPISLGDLKQEFIDEVGVRPLSVCMCA